MVGHKKNKTTRNSSRIWELAEYLYEEFNCCVCYSESCGWEYEDKDAWYDKAESLFNFLGTIHVASPYSRRSEAT